MPSPESSRFDIQRTLDFNRQSMPARRQLKVAGRYFGQGRIFRREQRLRRRLAAADGPFPLFGI